MYRNVYLLGSLGEQFGDKITVYANTLQEVVKLISVNRPGFDTYLKDCIDNNIGLAIEVEEEELDPTKMDILLPLKPGDITISALPAGAGGDDKPWLQILAGVVLFMINPALGAKATFMDKLIFNAVNTLAASLVSRGIEALMAPDPAEDEAEPTNYLFNGQSQNVVEGDPVPVLYGELKVPGTPISIFAHVEGDYHTQRTGIKHTIDPQGNISATYTY